MHSDHGRHAFARASGGCITDVSKRLSVLLSRYSMRLCLQEGSQPVSMDRENVKYLSKLKYCVCEKTDGVRYMLLIWKVGLAEWSEWQNRFYFIDRKFEFHVLKDVDLGAAGSFLESLT